MRKLVLIMLAALSLTACGNRGNKNKTAESVEAAVQITDPETVYVYYFHGKQRCKTCIAVENVTRETVSELYGDNPNVKFIEIKTDDKAHESLINEYEVTWNALIIAKGDMHNDITQYAFANAVGSPDILRELIKTEVDKSLFK